MGKLKNLEKEKKVKNYDEETKIKAEDKIVV